MTEILTYAHFHIGRGRVTAAIRKNLHVPNLYDVGLSFCSPKEQFVKATGRHLASTRATGETGFGLGVDIMVVRVRPEDTHSRSQLKTVIKDAVTDMCFGLENPNVIVPFGRIPNWVRKPDLTVLAKTPTEHQVADLVRWLDAYDRLEYKRVLDAYEY